MVSPIMVSFIGILWALILDGILVERGRGYAKIRFLGQRFQGVWKSFIFYIVEIIIISVLIAWLSTSIIPSLLTDYMWLTILLSVVAAYFSFKKDIFD